jgi:ketosteroid isomerase-like protein
MVASLADLHARFHIVEHEVKFIAADVDHVAASLVLRLRAKDNDRIIRSDMGNFFTLRNNRIVTYRQFIDSFDIVQQVLGRDIIGSILKPGG